MKQDNTDDKENDQTATYAKDIPIIPDHPQRNQGQPVRDPTSKDQKEDDEHIRWAEKWMVRLTAALVVASLASLGTAILQWRSSENQGVDAHKLAVAATNQSDAATAMATAAGDQVDAGNNFADSAEEINRGVAGAVDQLQAAAKNTRTTIRNAQTAFRDEQRAWVGVLGINDIKGLTETEPWTITVVFFNSGRTPARNVQSSGMFITSPIPIAGPPPEKIKQLIFRPTQSVAPQGTYREVMGKEVAAETLTVSEKQGFQTLLSQYQDIKKGALHLYYYGILKYDDIFGNHRETQFCILLADPSTKEAGFCDAFNDLN